MAYTAEQRRVVIMDLCFRLAEVELLLGDSDQALAATDRGIAAGAAADVFSANLYVARGRAFEALGRNDDAARTYHRALEINERLLEKELQRAD